MPGEQRADGHPMGCSQANPRGHLSGHLTSAADFYPEDVMSIFSSQGMLISTRRLGCPEIGLLKKQTGASLVAHW